MNSDHFGDDDRDRSRPWRVLGILAAVGLLTSFFLPRLGFGIGIRGLLVAGVVVMVASAGGWGRRRAHRAPQPEVPEEVLDELEDLRSRLLELEERADFSERLLAQDRERRPAVRGNDADS